ncbi:MAG: S46 family peptidase, partial [Bacteroidia bacterium]|nr:S46 family peptidase [Bacteroidia bacterium]
FLVILVLTTGLLAKAAPDEGMWLPIFVERLNYEEMQAMGLNLSAEEIYSINNSSLKDAIVNFGNFCTGEIVSPEGLILTNHHCGYEAIQSHSSIDHDYLTDGFWAMSKEEELPNKGLTATFFVRMADVTLEVLADVTDEMTEAERSKVIKEAMSTLETAASEEGKYTAEVKGFFNGNEYYLFVYEVYNDVRLVGAPPSAIGKFGGDTDNWMWPRHTGDFSMFRVYTAPDGSPAEYSEENVPMVAKRHLKVSTKGIEKNDFAMIWGYPGSTDRYRTSWGIDLTLNQINPAIDVMGEVVLSKMKEGMNQNDEVRIMYASKYAQIANLWKNKKGESRGLKRLKVFDKKKEIESEFAKWVAENPEKQEKYGTVLADFENAYQLISEKGNDAVMWNLQLGLFGCQAFIIPFQFKKTEQILSQKLKKDELNTALEPIMETIEAVYAEYDPATEKMIYTGVLKKLKEVLPNDQLPDIYNLINDKYKGDIDAFTDEVFKKSVYAS